MNVFISYSSKDTMIAEEVAEALRDHDIHPWLDTQRLPGGAYWKETVQEAAERADGFVFVLGDSSDVKQQFEWRSALRAQWDSGGGTKPMIPLLIGDVQPPPFLRDKIALRLPVPTANYDAIADHIVRSIKHPAEIVDPTSRLQANLEQRSRLKDLERFAESLKPATGQDTGTIRLNLVDGTRQPIPEDKDILLRVLDGRKQPIATKFVKGPTIPIMGLPFHDSPDDWYTLIAHADGYRDAGVYPVRLQAGRLIDAYLMLTPNDGAFHFPPLSAIPKDDGVYQLVANGAPGDVEDRYHNTLETQPQQLGALLTIGTAIRDVSLDDHTSPLKYYWEVIWDRLAPDRFWAWVDARLADRIKALAELHSFAAEPDAAYWHPGLPGSIRPATRKWKEKRLEIANLQLAFHEQDHQTRLAPSGETVSCVIVEPSIDYYKDVISHRLIEVIPNLATKDKTDPRNAYTLRWTATKQAGLEEFSPPCTIE